ncbi:TorD/DmsD family molecular chaperone [Neobacillus muris]|uniref:TorD/DmsD family molecular chaperone n=1 Tax=Neobacillus muris TaxID=2941334 RepID=UPI00203D36C6|nr:molecular chaperone TorD family protein [Neobacillus muris]
MNIENNQISSEEHQLLEGRLKFYQFLQLLLRMPITIKIFNEIKEKGYIEGLREFDQSGQMVHDFFYSENLEESIQMARQDFFGLFVGPEALLAPPWESVYRSKEKALFDFPTFEVRDLYSQYGLEVKKKEHHHDEADDHIVYELEFMLQLIERSIGEHDSDKRKSLLKGQQRMLKEHLLKWVPRFSTDIQNHGTSKLFIGLGALVNDFISFDDQLVEDLLRSQDQPENRLSEC